MFDDADVLTGSLKETEAEGKTMEKGRAVESISGPKCLPGPTGSLVASQGDEIMLTYRGDEREMKRMETTVMLTII